MESDSNYFIAPHLKKCETETPEMESFKRHKINVFVATTYGRPIFVRYGDEIKCSTFLGTMWAIFNKVCIFYSDNEQPSTINKVVHKHMTIYLLKRRNINYLCISKVPHDELLIMSMLDFLNMQLLSCLTDGVNNVLETNPTYDPTVNFSNSTGSLLSAAIKTGLHSPCILFNSLPVLPLPASARNQINTMMKENNEESLQIFILMTLSHVIAINKKKQVDLHVEDVFLLFNLLQTQKSLRNSQNWLTICLPGLSAEGNLFCYNSFLNDNFIVVMITDESFDKFYDFSSLCKAFKEDFMESEAFSKATANLKRPLVEEGTIERTKSIKHFLVKNNQLNQIVMSNFNYFGQIPKQFKKIMNSYAQVQRQQLITNCSKKQKMHLTRCNDEVYGVYVTGPYTVYFSAAEGITMDECKVALEGIFKWLKEEESNLFIYKYN